ncbi:MAG: hypothetical protein AAGG46_12430, partial [Planctomycetota bacterium]
MAKRRNRQRNQLLIVGGVMAALAAVVGAVAATSLGSGSPANPPSEVARETPEPGTPAEPTPPVDFEPAGPPLVPAGPPLVPVLVDDDGRTLWASPTGGGPIPLDYLPPDCQLVLHLRPAEMHANTQAARALDAIGPTGKRLVAQAESLIGLPMDQIRRLTVGVRPGFADELEATLVVERLSEVVGTDIARRGRDATHADEPYKIDGDWCYYSPPRTDTAADPGGRVVIAKRPALHEVLDAGGAPPPLRREMEQIVAASDADRHASLLVAPSFLFTSGRSLFLGDTAALRSPLFEETPDDLRAALVSVHW